MVMSNPVQHGLPFPVPDFEAVAWFARGFLFTITKPRLRISSDSFW